MAIGRRADIRECQSRADAHGNRAGTMTRRELIAWLALVRGASGVRPGGVVARRAAAATRQAIRPSVPGALHRCRERSRPDRAGDLRSGRPQELHHRGGGLRRGLLRLRQRRLARSVRAERHAPRGRRRFDQSSLQEQPRRHLYRCDGEGGLDAIGLGVGGDRRRLRQRRLRRSLHHLLRSQRPLPQQRRRHVHRRHREGGPAAGRRALRIGLHVGRLRSRRPSRSLRRDVPEHDAREAAETRREHATAAGRACR